MVEDLRDHREHRPPVAGRAGAGAGIGHRVAVGAEEHVVHDENRRRSLVPWNLMQSGHARYYRVTPPFVIATTSRAASSSASVMSFCSKTSSRIDRPVLTDSFTS